LAKRQVREVVPVAVPTESPGFSTQIEALRLREWHLGPGDAHLVLGLFSTADFQVVVDDRADSDEPGFSMEFGTATPAGVVAAAVARVLEPPRR
jgi:hypothetical protein